MAWHRLGNKPLPAQMLTKIDDTVFVFFFKLEQI